jgi:hypothetical protein
MYEAKTSGRDKVAWYALDKSADISIVNDDRRINKGIDGDRRGASQVADLDHVST